MFEIEIYSRQRDVEIKDIQCKESESVQISYKKKKKKKIFKKKKKYF